LSATPRGLEIENLSQTIKGNFLNVKLVLTPLFTGKNDAPGYGSRHIMRRLSTSSFIVS
jgi:hypothetical protein